MSTPSTAPTPKSSPTPWPSTPAPRSPCVSRCAEISAQTAEQFLNTFYFHYGHRSIADLAHIPMAVERLSLLAAIALVDEQRWDGQERSTRYQDFRSSGWFTPALGAAAPPPTPRPSSPSSPPTTRSARACSPPSRPASPARRR